MEHLIHDLVTRWFEFLLAWGYAGIVLMMVLESTAFPIPAEIVIPPAAYWAAQGKFSFTGVIIAGTLGGWIGSALSYWIAYKVGRPLFVKYGKYVFMPPEKLTAADRWFEEYGAGGIFIARLLPGIRHLISIPAGLFHMNFKVFSLMTILGAGSFCAFLAWFGQKVIGDQPALLKDPAVMMHALKEKSHYLIAFAVVIAVLYFVAHWMQKRLKREA